MCVGMCVLHYKLSESLQSGLGDTKYDVVWFNTTLGTSDSPRKHRYEVDNGCTLI